MIRPIAGDHTRTTWLATAALLFMAAPALAQGGAIALPLSGRTAGVGSAGATQTALPGATSSVNTVSPTVLVQGPLSGSRTGSRVLSGPLGFRDAVQRGLDYNLGSVSVAQMVQQARSQRTIARSALLPNLSGDLSVALQQLNLAAQGFDFGDAIEGFTIPRVVSFHNVDIRARLSQTLFDRTSLNNYRSTRESARAMELSADDARDLVVLAVGGTYLQVQAARARLDATATQVETAEALLKQTRERQAVGLLAKVDVDRAEIQALTQRQRLTALRSDLVKLKINLVRMIGLGASDQYELADAVPFAQAPELGLDEAIRRAGDGRADLKAADAQLRAAELALAAARAEHLPTVGVTADYGTIGSSPSTSERTYGVAGRVRIPIWDGGRTSGRIAQAETVVAQRRAERDDLAGQIEAEVRKAFLDLAAAKDQVELTRRNGDVTREVLELTRQRFEAGVGENVEVVQAQEAVATAAYDYINSVFAHNLSKLNLARAMGQAADRYAEFLMLPDGGTSR